MVAAPEIRCFPAKTLSDFSTAVFMHFGVPQADAELAADVLAKSDLRGIDSHGVVSLLPVFAAAPGRAGPAPTVVEERGAAAVVDGRGALGLRTARVALEAAIRRARALGAGVAVARNVGYLGGLWWTVLPAAEQGLVALGATNSMACVAPHGGREPLHGTNPIAAAVPCEPDPIVVDMRTNALRMADYWEAVRTGGSLPDGALMTSEGEPLTDANAVDDAVYLPLAGPKGYGLALLVDVLAGALAGAPIGREVEAETERDGLGAFFLVLEPGFFGPSEHFSAAVRRLADQAHATAPLDRREPVRLPGERSAAERRRRLAGGIPVDSGLWALHEERLAKLGLAVEGPAFAHEAGLP
jgi:LDH2 family malate/lactate/ureidoglycolate dehydrogenase